MDEDQFRMLYGRLGAIGEQLEAFARSEAAIAEAMSSIAYSMSRMDTNLAALAWDDRERLAVGQRLPDPTNDHPL